MWSGYVREIEGPLSAMSDAQELAPRLRNRIEAQAGVKRDRIFAARGPIKKLLKG